MQRGGKRPGAGRKKGTQNKSTMQRQQEIASKGITPLEYMLEVLRNVKENPVRRDWAAAAAAPYIHSRMPQALVPTSPLGSDQDAAPEDREIISLYLGGIHAEADGD